MNISKQYAVLWNNNHHSLCSLGVDNMVLDSEISDRAKLATVGLFRCCNSSCRDTVVPFSTKFFICFVLFLVVACHQDSDANSRIVWII